MLEESTKEKNIFKEFFSELKMAIKEDISKPSELLTPNEICKRYGLAKPIVYNILNMSLAQEYLLERGHGRRYYITDKNFEKLINNKKVLATYDLNKISKYRRN